jgi:hypothetical protein
MIKSRLLVAAPVLLGVVWGCGSRNPNAPAEVSGTIKYNGQPLKGGTVTFHTKDTSTPYQIPIRPDGTYSASDLPAGELLVSIETESVNPNKKKAPEFRPGFGMKTAGKKYKEDTSGYKEKLTAQGAAAPTAPDPAAYTKIPAKYADPNTSGFTAALSRGRNTQDFNLTD